MASHHGKLEWLEVGRGLAACAVVFCHGSELFPPSLQFFSQGGEWAVDFFFILSGFIIHHVHRNDIGNPGRAANFVWRRLIRIIPTYWLILIIALLIRQFLGNEGYRIAIDGSFLLHNFLLLPGGGLFVTPAWTLRHEFLFYAIFLVVILNVRIGLAIFALWVVLILSHLSILDPAFNPDHPIMETLSGWRNLFFFVGMGASMAFQRWPIPLDVRHGAKLALWLGAISYPIYLLHRICFWIAHGLIKRTGTIGPEWISEFTLGVAIAIFGAHLIAFGFEPLVRSAFRKRRPATVPS
jgi:peptidoglycan/LPS O-acetylase OafA/YrhL